MIEDEEKIKRILTDPKLSVIKSILEKRFGIECLLLLHLDCGRRKKYAEFMREKIQTSLDGNTVRVRMKELEKAGLATRKPLNILQREYVITERGEQAANTLLKLLTSIEELNRGK